MAERNLEVPLVNVVNVLIEEPILVQKWKEFSRTLHLSESDLHQLDIGYKIGTTKTHDLFFKIIHQWVSTISKVDDVGTVGNLAQVLRDNKFINAADRLEKAFSKNEEAGMSEISTPTLHLLKISISDRIEDRTSSKPRHPIWHNMLRPKPHSSTFLPELELIHDSFEKFRNDRTCFELQVIWISGEALIGKSELVRRFATESLLIKKSGASFIWIDGNDIDSGLREFVKVVGINIDQFHVSLFKDVPWVIVFDGVVSTSILKKILEKFREFPPNQDPFVIVTTSVTKLDRDSFPSVSFNPIVLNKDWLTILNGEGLSSFLQMRITPWVLKKYNPDQIQEMRQRSLKVNSAIDMILSNELSKASQAIMNHSVFSILALIGYLSDNVFSISDFIHIFCKILCKPQEDYGKNLEKTVAIFSKAGLLLKSDQSSKIKREYNLNCDKEVREVIKIYLSHPGMKAIISNIFQIADPNEYSFLQLVIKRMVYSLGLSETINFRRVMPQLMRFDVLNPNFFVEDSNSILSVDCMQELFNCCVKLFGELDEHSVVSGAMLVRKLREQELWFQSGEMVKKLFKVNRASLSSQGLSDFTWEMPNPIFQYNVPKSKPHPSRFPSELKQLHQYFEKSLNMRELHPVVVVGESPIGKSNLVLHFISEIFERESVSCIWINGTDIENQMNELMSSVDTDETNFCKTLLMRGSYPLIIVFDGVTDRSIPAFKMVLEGIGGEVDIPQPFIVITTNENLNLGKYDCNRHDVRVEKKWIDILNEECIEMFMESRVTLWVRQKINKKYSLNDAMTNMMEKMYSFFAISNFVLYEVPQDKEEISAIDLLNFKNLVHFAIFIIIGCWEGGALTGDLLLILCKIICKFQTTEFNELLVVIVESYLQFGLLFETGEGPSAQNQKIKFNESLRNIMRVYTDHPGVKSIITRLFGTIYPKEFNLILVLTNWTVRSLQLPQESVSYTFDELMTEVLYTKTETEKPIFLSLTDTERLYDSCVELYSEKDENSLLAGAIYVRKLRESEMWAESGDLVKKLFHSSKLSTWEIEMGDPNLWYNLPRMTPESSQFQSNRFMWWVDQLIQLHQSFADYRYTCRVNGVEIAGDPLIGKSELVQAFLSELHSINKVSCIRIDAGNIAVEMDTFLRSIDSDLDHLCEKLLMNGSHPWIIVFDNVTEVSIPALKPILGNLITQREEQRPFIIVLPNRSVGIDLKYPGSWKINYISVNILEVFNRIGMPGFIRLCVTPWALKTCTEHEQEELINASSALNFAVEKADLYFNSNLKETVTVQDKNVLQLGVIITDSLRNKFRDSVSSLVMRWCYRKLSQDGLRRVLASEYAIPSFRDVAMNESALEIGVKNFLDHPGVKSIVLELFEIDIQDLSEISVLRLIFQNGRVLVNEDGRLLLLEMTRYDSLIQQFRHEISAQDRLLSLSYEEVKEVYDSYVRLFGENADDRLKFEAAFMIKSSASVTVTDADDLKSFAPVFCMIRSQSCHFEGLHSKTASRDTHKQLGAGLGEGLNE